MTVITFKCDCGNKDPKKTIEYDGSLGYEAIVCTECSCYYDYNGKQEADDWSKEFVKNRTAYVT